MSTFKERMVEEIDQLQGKIIKLTDFTYSENFKNIDSVQQSLLRVQLSAMHTYHHCLAERLAWLPEELMP